MVESDTVPTQHCPRCRETVPVGVFCGRCGADMTRPLRALLSALRPHAYVAAPREPVLLPAVTSTLFPELPQMYRHPFRIGMAILLYRRIWWPPAVWVALIVATVYSGAPFGNPFGRAIEQFSQFFYNDPRRLTGVVTMLLTPMAGIGLFAAVTLGVLGARRAADRLRPLPAPVWPAVTAVLLVAATVLGARHYPDRHLFLFGDKYDSVIIDRRDLMAMAYLAKLPGAHDTLIGNSNVDGTAWMYAVADLHPLWTHYDYPQQTGPGPYRFVFWSSARKGASDPKVVEAVKALNIRYILTSVPNVRGFATPDGLVSLDKSTSWSLVYDNGGARIYEWRADAGASHP